MQFHSLKLCACVYTNIVIWFRLYIYLQNYRLNRIDQIGEVSPIQRYHIDDYILQIEKKVLFEQFIRFAHEIIFQYNEMSFLWVTDISIRTTLLLLLLLR